jgi:hypothetical protein
MKIQWFIVGGIAAVLAGTGLLWKRRRAYQTTESTAQQDEPSGWLRHAQAVDRFFAWNSEERETFSKKYCELEDTFVKAVQSLPDEEALRITLCQTVGMDLTMMLEAYDSYKKQQSGFDVLRWRCDVFVEGVESAASSLSLSDSKHKICGHLAAELVRHVVKDEAREVSA